MFYGGQLLNTYTSYDSTRKSFKKFPHTIAPYFFSPSNIIMSGDNVVCT